MDHADQASTTPSEGHLAPVKGPAWSEPELADPHARADKADRVRRMFAAIAPSYDLNNRLHSLWRDQAWRREAVRAAAVRPGERVLDVACGTGDLALAFARRSPASEVIGLDYTPEMLDLAERKRGRLDPETAGRVRFLGGDAQNLPFSASSFDALSIAFGIRNVQDPAAAAAEFLRVLRPGGRLVILEFATPGNPMVRAFNNFYSGWLMPRTASLIARDRSGAYRYLPKSVGTFLTPQALSNLLSTKGFQNITTRPLSLGICCLYRAVRP